MTPQDTRGSAKTALSFIAGLLEHAPALCGLTNPSTNSYKRLVPGYEAPVSICFATANRSAVVRIPDYARAPEQKRFEIRSPDATCNPYLAFAAILMAGLDGVERGLDPVELGYGPYDVNLYQLAGGGAEEDQVASPGPSTRRWMRSRLTTSFCLKAASSPSRSSRRGSERKREEARQINLVPHPAEFAYYYDL